MIAFAKPLLRAPYERNEISKDAFKTILKKVAEKVVGSFRKEGIPPPPGGEQGMSAKQREKIGKLVEDYIEYTKRRGGAIFM